MGSHAELLAQAAQQRFVGQEVGVRSDDAETLTSARPDSTPRFDQNPTPRITIHEIREACMQLDRFYSTSDGDMACSSAGAGRQFRATETGGSACSLPSLLRDCGKPR